MIIVAKVEIYAISELSHFSKDKNGILKYTSHGFLKYSTNDYYRKILIKYEGKTIISSNDVEGYENFFEYYVEEYNKGNIITEVIIDKREIVTYEFKLFKPF